MAVCTYLLKEVAQPEMYVHKTEHTTVSECIKLSYLLQCENSSGDEDPSQGEKLLDKNTNKMSQN